jgi:hypothetical protein
MGVVKNNNKTGESNPLYQRTGICFLLFIGLKGILIKPGYLVYTGISPTVPYTLGPTPYLYQVLLLGRKTVMSAFPSPL